MMESTADKHTVEELLDSLVDVAVNHEDVRLGSLVAQLIKKYRRAEVVKKELKPLPDDPEKALWELGLGYGIDVDNNLILLEEIEQSLCSIAGMEVNMRPWRGEKLSEWS